MGDHNFGSGPELSAELDLVSFQLRYSPLSATDYP